MEITEHWNRDCEIFAKNCRHRIDLAPGESLCVLQVAELEG